jgi:uncharacterized membrane protein YvlD (DUF360 family)
MVILLCTVNAVTWEMYTQSTFMAVLWGAIALAFAFWIADDAGR